MVALDSNIGAAYLPNRVNVHCTFDFAKLLLFAWIVDLYASQRHYQLGEELNSRLEHLLSLVWISS